jgi:hypothetical protein
MSQVAKSRGNHLLDQSREKTCSNRQRSVVEIVMRIMDGAAADGAGIANVDKGAGKPQAYRQSLRRL